MLSLVKEARERYDALDPGLERAGKIVNYVAYNLAGAGTFYKPNGTQWNKRSIDVVIFKDGKTFDCLIDAEGKAEPCWKPTKPSGRGDTRKWRQPYHPGGDVLVKPPPVEEEPKTPIVPIKSEIVDEVIKSLALLINERFNEITLGLAKAEARLALVEATEYEVNAGTSRYLAHAHQLSARVTKVVK
jgi:hypothetical protein